MHHQEQAAEWAVDNREERRGEERGGEERKERRERDVTLHDMMIK